MDRLFRSRRAARAIVFFLAAFCFLWVSPYETPHKFLISLTIALLGLVNRVAIVGAIAIALLMVIAVIPREIVVMALT